MAGVSISDGFLPPTRAGAVAQQLRKMILSGELPGGSRLRQNEIAKLFNVSTTPVREAFMMLSREGIITQDAHRGAIVFSASADDVRENYEIRIALETLAVGIAAKNISVEQIATLESLLADMKVAMRENMELYTSTLHPRFHSSIYAASNRPKLTSMIESARGAALAYQALLVTPQLSHEYLAEVHAEHQEILNALKKHSPSRAARAVRTHIEHNLAKVLDALAERPTETAAS